MPNWIRVAGSDNGGAVYLLDNLDASSYLYRYMSANHGLATLREQSLYLSNVQRWIDPYERWWCEVLFHEGSKLRDVNVFGTCWTTRRRSEPFWRLYEDRCSHRDARGNPLPKSDPPIRLKAKLANLIQVFAATVSQQEAKVYIGQVRYDKTVDIVQNAKRLLEGKEVSSIAAASMMTKRLSFRFEREVRALWIDRRLGRESRSVAFDRASLIEQVMVGPAREADVANALKLRLGKFLEAGKVKRSLIYKAPAPPTNSVAD